MKLEPKEKTEVQNLIKIIRRAKFDDFQGLEALALARAYHWLESLLIEKPEPANVATPVPMETKGPFEVFENEVEEKPKKKRTKKNV